MMRLDLERWKSCIPVEPRSILVLGGLSGLLLLLAKIIEDVVEKESGKFDQAVLLALRVSGNLSQPIGPEWLKPFFIDISALGSPITVTLVTAVAVTYLATAGRLRLAAFLGGAVFLGATIEKSMKIGFDRARPEIIPHFEVVHTLSFPSGHTMMSAIAYLTIGALVAGAQDTQRMKIFVLVVSLLLNLLVGISRIYLGVHWPTDVLAAWTAGAAWALATWFVAEKMR